MNRGLARRALLVVLPVGCLLLVACTRPPAADDVTVEIALTPDPPVVGSRAVAALTIRDRDRRPVRGARVHVEAHMSHPGMTPLVVEAAEGADGVHEVPLQFTMAGDWTIHVIGTLADGRRLDRWLPVPGVRPAE